MKVALVGPSLSGKSTLFTAVTGIPADPAKSRGATSQVGAVKVLDPRLDFFVKEFQPKKTTYATLELMDFAGLDLGARNENTKQQIAAIREADALLVVLQAFGGMSPDKIKQQWNAIQSEFLFGDLEVIERRVTKLRASTKLPTKTQEQDKRELAALEIVQAHLEKNERWDGMPLNEEQLKLLRGFRLLMQKPCIPVLNADDVKGVDPVACLPATHSAKALVLNVSVEKDVKELPEAEQGAFLKEFGINEPAAPRVIRAAYSALGLISFFTVGPDECRAWTINIGDNAVTAAGRIHTDLAKSFIRAEVFTYDDYVALGSEKEIKAKGKFRLEGKDYIVKDGDVLNIRHAA